MAERLVIDYTPLEEFRYNQISNYKFEFMLVNHDMKVVHSPFECKDYLQDIFWCETMKKKSSVFGLSWKPGMFDITTPFFYMALSGGSVILNTHIEALQEFLNTFEKNLGIEPTVIYETENEKIIVLKFSKEWTINGPMLSTYTTLIRIAGAYKRGQDVVEYLGKVKAQTIKVPDYTKIERIRLTNSNFPKLMAVLQGKRPNHRWEDIETIGMAHDTGITNFPGYPRAEMPQKA